MVQSPGLRSPTSGVQAKPLTIAPRLHAIQHRRQDSIGESNIQQLRKCKEIHSLTKRDEKKEKDKNRSQKGREQSSQ